MPTVCAGNVSLLGEKISDPPVRTPFPETVMGCVAEAPCGPALSVIAMRSVRNPTEVGSKTIWMMQVPPPPGMEVPHVLVCWKSPLEVMLEMLKAVLPSLVSVTMTGLLGLSSG